MTALAAPLPRLTIPHQIVRSLVAIAVVATGLIAIVSSVGLGDACFGTPLAEAVLPGDAAAV